MLASAPFPILSFSPQQTSEDASQYRPVRDIEAFNSLLPPPIEFIEGSSSGALAVPEGQYTPVNVSPKASKPDIRDVPPTSPSSSPIARKSTPPPLTSLYPGVIDPTWPKSVSVGSGFCNTGNSCFLNSALQCLLHTPPLVRVLISHSKVDPCGTKDGFCMACNMRIVMLDAQRQKRPFTPLPITTKLQAIAKHMRRGRQEDAHEFLRYAIDALQKACLAGFPPKLDHKLTETTWVHKIFGGRLRSRVTCRECHHPSDTFDSILDLSLDIHGVDTLKDALRKFVAIDYLKGADRYKCEKCNKSVNAEKQFTVHEAPLVLTVHLKRFSPLGRKIGHHIKYEDQLSLRTVMSQGQFGPSYLLYGVICHAGGGPNSGHYYAHVRASDGRWYEMNDDSVTMMRNPPVGLKNAYVLLYIRDKGQALEAAVAGSSNHPPIPPKAAGIAAAMKRRKILLSDDEDEGEDKGVATSRPFIGPQLPSPQPPPPAIDQAKIPAINALPIVDPQAELVKRRIAAATAPAGSPLAILEEYGGSSSDEGETKGDAATMTRSSTAQDSQANVPASQPTVPPSSPAPPPPTSSPPPSHSPTPITISVADFYASTPKKSEGNLKKRKSIDCEDDLKDYARTPLQFSSPVKNRPPFRKLSAGSNPYSRLSGGSNLRAERPHHLVHKYGGKRKRPIM